MKTIRPSQKRNTALAFGAAALLTATTALPAFAQSKRDTAEYYLAYGKENVDKDVRLDVAFVKPVHWASPDPEITFFHALTLDTRDHKFGGGILLMLPESEKEGLIKKYGMNPDGFRASTLRGILRVLPNRERPGAGVYVVDYKGLLGDKIKNHVAKMGVIDDAGSAGNSAPPPDGSAPAQPGTEGAAVGETSTVVGGEAATPQQPGNAGQTGEVSTPGESGPGFRRPFRRPPGMEPDGLPLMPGEGRPRPFRKPFEE